MLSYSFAGRACIGKPASAIAIASITGNNRSVRKNQLTLDIAAIQTVRVVDRSSECPVDLALDQLVLVRTDGSPYGNLFFQMADACVQCRETVYLALVQAECCVVQLLRLVVVQVTDSLVIAEVTVYLRLVKLELLSYVRITMVVISLHARHLSPHMAFVRAIASSQLLSQAMNAVGAPVP